MITNYIKLAWRILGRKKFFTGISLFGISFTLGILMVILSFLQSEMGTQKPMSQKDDFVLVEQLQLQRIYYDTITNVDTVIQNNIALYDTTYNYERRGAMMWNSNMNNGIAEEYFKDMSTVDEMTIFNEDTSYDVYIDGVKVTINALYGDPSYFEVFDHELIEGRTIDQTDMDNANQVAVISVKCAEQYFGTSQNVVGKEMEVDGKTFKVVGLYPHKGKIREFICPHMVIPYTIVNEKDQPTFYHGFYAVVFKKNSLINAKKVKEEIAERAKTIPLDHPSKPDGYNEVIFKPKTYDEMIANGIYYDEDAEVSYNIMKWVLFSLLAFFILLPTLNLINLNVSRIMDRSSEIGVRKAFGAHQGNILSQFIIENIVQTILGGIIGLALALVVINAINKGGALGESVLQLSPKFFIYSFFITFIFGILSGLLPAYKMSKLQIVQALKSNKL
jgi:putative ABC transport system permease protein